MCGRFVFFEPDKIEDRFNVKLDKSLNINPSYNIAPTEETLIIINENDRKRADLFKWGFIPSWIKDKENFKPLINLRDDTLLNKQNFSYYLKNNRCLIPANGFYEWRILNGRKKPYFIYLKDFSLFFFAGVYNKIYLGESELKTFTIITTKSNEKLRLIHDRMPVILEKEVEEAWLDRGINDLSSLRKLIKPYKDIDIQFHEVSHLVNNPKNKFKELILPYNRII